MIHLVEDASCDNDNQRREIKYLLSCADHCKLSDMLRGSCFPISYNNQKASLVNSVYFDSYGLSSCLANVDGLSNRYKFRIRWYDRPVAEDGFFLR